MYKCENKPFLFEIDELPKEVQNFALHSFIEKSKAIHTIIINRSKQRNIHEVINNKYHLNRIIRDFRLIQKCRYDLEYCRKIVKGNLCLFTLQGVYVPFMFNV